MHAFCDDLFLESAASLSIWFVACSMEICIGGDGVWILLFKINRSLNRNSMPPGIGFEDSSRV